MTIYDFLTKVKKTDYTFTIAKAVKDDNTPFYHYEYYQTPILYIDEWLRWAKTNDYIVISPDCCPICIPGYWQKWYTMGVLSCAIITTEKDLYTMYYPVQAKRMINYYDNLVNEWLKK